MSVLIGMESIADRAGVAVSSPLPATAYPIENAVDWLPYDYWQIDTADVAPSIVFTNAQAQAVDYIALAAHDLLASDEINVQTSSDGAAWVDALAWVAVGDGVLFKSFTQVSAVFFRVVFRRGVTAFAPKIGMVLLGSSLDLTQAPQIGFTPPLADNAELKTNRSMNGVFLGRTVIPEAGDMRISLKLLTADFVRASIVPLHEHIKSKPIIVSWDEVNHPSESVLCWVEKSPKLPSYSHASFMRYDLRLAVSL